MQTKIALGNHVLIDLYAQIATLSRVTASIAKKGEERARGEREIRPRVGATRRGMR